MKKILLIIVLCIIYFFLFAQSKLPPLQIRHLTDNFYVYVSCGSYQGKNIPAIAMYLVTKDGVVLFDTPWAESYYQPLLDSIWAKHHKKVVLCISTHFHEEGVVPIPEGIPAFS